MRRKLMGLVGACLMLLGLVVVADSAQAAPGDPKGSFDAVSRWPGGVRVQGWALDPDLVTAPTDVHVYVDGTGIACPVSTFSDAFGLG